MDQFNCESKCESGFDWLTFQLTAVIFDRLWLKGPLVDITFSFPDHKVVVHLKEKKLANAWAWGHPGVSQGGARL